ncbi:hypothetical protein J6E39_00115 [bacterium]|nr:hypothetical protein [bacterium]
MDDEKRLCPNCGKELTKSARKCKYCETRIVPVKIQTTREEKLVVLLACVCFLVIVAIVVALLALSGKTVINTWTFINEHVDLLWSALKIIGIIILFIIIAFITYISGVLTNKKVYKTLAFLVIGVVALNWISEHLEEIKFILGIVLFLGAGLFLNGGKSTPNNVKEESVNVGSVIIKGSNATIYDVSGTKLETISVIEPTTLMSCGGKCFTLRCKNRIETYEYRGGLFGFVRISSRNV